MKDRIHQPYRAQICPMLPRLLPLAGGQGILGVALSGAGPGVLAIVGNEESLEQASAAIRAGLEGFEEPELVVCRFLPAGASQSLETGRIGGRKTVSCLEK
jgi:homoserine kinase